MENCVRKTTIKQTLCGPTFSFRVFCSDSETSCQPNNMQENTKKNQEKIQKSIFKEHNESKKHNWVCVFYIRFQHKKGYKRQPQTLRHQSKSVAGETLIQQKKISIFIIIVSSIHSFIQQHYHHQHIKNTFIWSL